MSAFLYCYIIFETQWPGAYQSSKTIGPASPRPVRLPAPSAGLIGVHHCVHMAAGERTRAPKPVQQARCCQNPLPSLMPRDVSWELGHSHRLCVLKTQILFPICSCKAKEKAVLASRWPLTVTGEKRGVCMSRGPRKYVTKLQKLLPVDTEAAFSFSCLC